MSQEKSKTMLTQIFYFLFFIYFFFGGGGGRVKEVYYRICASSECPISSAFDSGPYIIFLPIC